MLFQLFYALHVAQKEFQVTNNADGETRRFVDSLLSVCASRFACEEHSYAGFTRRQVAHCVPRQICGRDYVRNAQSRYVRSALSPSFKPVLTRTCLPVWYTSSVVVKIVDFGLARLRLRGSGPEEIIYNVRDQFSEMFNASLDAEKVLAVIARACVFPVRDVGLMIRRK